MTGNGLSGVKAVLVGLDMGVSSHSEDLGEFRELALSAGFAPVDQIGGKRLKPDSATFAGSGKVEEIALAVKASGAQFVLMNHDISAVQERNLERLRSDPHYIERVIRERANGKPDEIIFRFD